VGESTDKLGPQAADYKEWLKALKTRVRQVQLKAAIAVNQELLGFYWELGADMVEKQKSAAWGSGFIKQLSQDLRAEFPEMKGFSFSNIKYIRQRFLFYSDALPKGQQADARFEKQPVSQISNRWWGKSFCASAEEIRDSVSDFGRCKRRPRIDATVLA